MDGNIRCFKAFNRIADGNLTAQHIDRSFRFNAIIGRRDLNNAIVDGNGIVAFDGFGFGILS